MSNEPKTDFGKRLEKFSQEPSWPLKGPPTKCPEKRGIEAIVRGTSPDDRTRRELRRAYLDTR